jgi:hypothetical protein
VRVGAGTGSELGRLSGMNTSRAVRLMTRRVPLLLAFVLGAVLAGPVGVDNVPAPDPSAAVSAAAAPVAEPLAVHVDADRSSTAPMATTVLARTAIVAVAARTLLDDGPRVVPAQRGPPPLFA